MIKKEHKIIIKEYKQANDLGTEFENLINQALKTIDNAYAPYSNFKVGASVLLNNNEIFTGSNQENAAYPSGLCAERVALFYANSKFPDVAVKAIAICAKNKNGILPQPVPPCGSCRQVILESEIRFKSDIKIILVGTNCIQVIESAKQLLPLHFNSENFNT